MFRQVWCCNTFEEGLDVKIDRSWHYSDEGTVVDNHEIVVSVTYDVGDTRGFALSSGEARSMAKALLLLAEDIVRERDYAGGKDAIPGK